MADTVQFDLVSPERLLASVDAKEVQIPGAEGDMTALPDHAPLITTLRPGVLKVTSSEGAAEYVVTGGFAEISPAGISVLGRTCGAQGRHDTGRLQRDGGRGQGKARQGAGNLRQ